MILKHGKIDHDQLPFVNTEHVYKNKAHTVVVVSFHYEPMFDFSKRKISQLSICYNMQNQIMQLTEINLTQQKEEKHMPIYNHGTRTPEISAPSYVRRDPGSLGKLFKFQPDFTYFSSEEEAS